MKYRKLRIAASLFFGLLTVAILVLWVRSYWYWDSLQTISGYRIFGLLSDSGYVSPSIAVAVSEDELMQMSFGQFHKSWKIPEGRQGPFDGFDVKSNVVYSALIFP